jgi:hypothetical protein
VLYGESGSGKTFVAVDLACHIAAGKAWRGLDVEQGIVVYIAAESPTSIKRRIWAWKRRHEVEHLPVAVVTASVNLLNGDTEKVIALINRIREQIGKPVAFVVIDTLARAMVGNENSPEDMGAFVSSCDRIREASGGHVMVVHHSGKDQARGARGHSSLRAATDVEMEVIKGDGARSITVKKNRDGEEGDTYGFKLDIVELGENAKGRMITTCVAAPAEAPVALVAKVANDTPPGANQRIVRSALGEALCEHGRPAPDRPGIPTGVKVVTAAQWQEQAVQRLPKGEVKYKVQAFNRAMERLVADGYVGFLDELAWLPPTPVAKVAKVANPDLPPLQPPPNRPVAKVAKVAAPYRGATFATATGDGRPEYDGCSDRLGDGQWSDR